MIQQLNYICTKFFDIILYPFSFIGEFWGVLFLSVLMAFVVLYIYKWISSPSLVKATKNQIKGNILAIRLYKDLWKVILSSFFKSLMYTFKYFFLNFGPVILIIPILFPAFVQMDIRYGMKPFGVGDEIMIKAAFKGNPHDLNVQLEPSEYYEMTMKPVVINAMVQDNLHELVKDELTFDDGNIKKVRVSEVNWKVKTLKEGQTAIKIKIGDKVYEKSLSIGSGRGAMSNRKMAESSWDHFMYPAEKLLKEGDLENIYISYPGKDITFLGITMNWLWYNLILVLVVVILLFKRFGIEF